METVSFVVGMTGLIGLVDKSLSLCRHIQKIREFADDVSELLFRLENEVTKAHCWSLDIKNSQLVPHHDQSVTHTNLRALLEQQIETGIARIGKALSEAESICQSYQLMKNSSSQIKDISLATGFLPSLSAISIGSHGSDLDSKITQHQRKQTLTNLSTRKKAKFTCKPWGVDDQQKLTELIKTMSYWNRELSSVLSLQKQRQLEFQVSCSIMSRANDATTLSTIESAAPAISPSLAASARLSRNRLSLEQDQTKLVTGSVQPWSSIHVVRSSGRYSLARDKSGTNNIAFLIDWAGYRHLNEQQQQIAQTRVDKLCLLMSSGSKPEKLQTLPSSGYVDDSARKRLGMLLKVPEGLEHDSRSIGSVQSLYDLLKMAREPSKIIANHRPSLPQRLRLARKLSYSFMELHSARWLHKGFRSEKVVFFATNNRDALDEMQVVDFDRPYIVGFEFARQSGKENVSLPVISSDTSQIYMHPDLQTDLEPVPGGQEENVVIPHRRFKQVYDLYSLALVLIEIGLWQPLSTLFKETTPPGERPDVFRKVASRNLSHTMGPRYRDVVFSILNWNNNIGAAGDTAEDHEEDEEDEEEWREGLDRAYEEIIRPLEECICGLK